MTGIKSIRDDVIRIVEGYKDIQFLLYCIKEKKTELLPNVYTYGEAILLESLENYIRYQENDYSLYTKIQESIDHGPILKNPHDIDLDAYVKGIYERNKLVWLGVDIDAVFEFTKHKKVLDFGCGGGFYTEVFEDLGATVYSYDRPSIAEIVNAHSKGFKVGCEPFETLKKIIHGFDIVWVSEVIHGKNETESKKLLESIVDKMDNGATLAINELKPNTKLSKFFDYQMKLHCHGKLYTIDDVAKLTNKLPLSMYRIIYTDYHSIILYKKGEESNELKYSA